MSYWNYRVTRQYVKEHKEFVYCIRIVYYNNDGSINLWTENPTVPFGTDFEELKHDVELFRLAVDKPVLELIVEGNKEKLIEVDNNG